MEFFIRRASVEDAQSMIELLNPIIQAEKYTIMDQPITLDDQLAFIEGFSLEGIFNVALCENAQKILGFQDIRPILPGNKAFQHVGEISTFVSLESQRKGVGKSLSAVTFKEAKVQGFLKIIAIVRADNPQALAFYSTQGFQTIGTAQKHAFVGGKYIDEVWMEKFLDGATDETTC